MKIEVEVDVDDSHELLELIAEFKAKKEKEKYEIKSVNDLLAKYGKTADSLQAEKHHLHNDYLADEEYERVKEMIAELEEKENELAKEIAYRIYRGEAIVLDRDYEPF